MILVCELCGGSRDAAIIAAAVAAWSAGCYMLARVFGWLWRRK
jgi:Kef-type K+ transport system membrane component KefB